MEYGTDNNQSTNSTARVYGDNASPVFILFSIILSAWIIIFNVIVLICFIQNRKLLIKSTFAMQICLLSVCDIYVGFSTLPVYISGFSRGVRYEFCAFSFILFISSQVVVLFHLLGICLYRLWIVCRVMVPNRVRAEKTDRVFVYLVINGIASLGIFTVPFVIWGIYRQKLYFCSLPEMFTEGYKSALSYCILFYIVPALLTNAVYVSIIVKLCCTSPQTSKQRNDSSSQGNDSAEMLNTNEAPPRGNIATHRDSLNVQSLANFANKRWNNYTESDIASAECHKIYAISFRQTRDSTTYTDSQQPSTSAESASLKQSYPLSGIHGDRVGETENEEGYTICFEEVELDQRAKSTLQSSNAQTRAIVLTGLVLFLFDICVAPFIILISIESQSEIDMPRNWKLLGTTLLTVNSAIDPFIYMWKFAEFRRALKNTCRSLSCKFC